MDKILIKQLAQLAREFHKNDVKPIICGGLGVYLSLLQKSNEEIGSLMRATLDVDLMFCRNDLLDSVKRKAMAEVITVKLDYKVQPDKKYHGFIKDGNQQLDILVPPAEGLPKRNYRLKIIESVLHGHITEEARFIDEDLGSISLSEITKEKLDEMVNLYIPSPVNFIIMKLFAFNDRITGNRKDLDRAVAHSFDLYLIIMTTNITDLKAGLTFLHNHRNSKIIHKAKEIAKERFLDFHKDGWQSILQSRNFYPQLTALQRQEKLEQASMRLVRWFD